MNDFNIANALVALGISSGWKISNGKIVKWWADKPQPTEEAINAKITELQADYNATQYQRDRKLEYPTIEECIHAILDDDLEALQAKRTAVKTKYPKPE